MRLLSLEDHTWIFSKYLHLLHQNTCLTYLFDYINQDLKVKVVKTYIFLFLIGKLNCWVYIYRVKHTIYPLYIYTARRSLCVHTRNHIETHTCICGEPHTGSHCASTQVTDDLEKPSTLPSKWTQTDYISAHFLNLHFYTLSFLYKYTFCTYHVQT